MGPVGVVLLAPRLHDDPGLGDAAELLEVQQLVPDPAVEGLDERVLPRRPGFDVGGARATETAPLPQRPGDQLRAVQRPQHLGDGAAG